ERVLEHAPCDHLAAFIDTLQRVGVGIECGIDTIDVDGSACLDGGYRACDISTAPYPGLATDLQPPTSVLLTQAVGRSNVHETIFEDRLEWLGEVRPAGGLTALGRPPPPPETTTSRATR